MGNYQVYKRKQQQLNGKEILQNGFKFNDWPRLGVCPAQHFYALKSLVCFLKGRWKGFLQSIFGFGLGATSKIFLKLQILIAAFPTF